MSNFNAGHLRAIIALIFVLTINVGFIFTEKISMELYATWAGGALTYYFTKKESGDSPTDVTALNISTPSVVLSPTNQR